MRKKGLIYHRIKFKRAFFWVFVVFFFLWDSNVYAFDEVHASVTYSNEDVDIFNRYIQSMEEKKDLPFNQLIIETALFFRNVPYVVSTLESEEEHLIINLREQDCTTFVENVIALVYTVSEDFPSFDRFCDYLRLLRYRNGNVSSYMNRLHYFSDWIYENEQIGFVRDMTKQIGGMPLLLNLSFVSDHPESYPRLTFFPEFVEVMKEKEQEISARNIYAMIDKTDINKVSREIKDGDIVCFVTKIAGLDISHVGFVYWQGNMAKLIHASSAATKVIIDLKSLQQYAEKIKSTIGIMIVRPQKPFF